MKPFYLILKEQTESSFNERYFNMLKHKKWLPAIQYRNKKTSSKPKIEKVRDLFLLEPGKEN